MELQKAIETRHSVRKFKEADIPAQDIEEIIGAAVLAPSAKNVQNWFFAAIKNEGLKRKIAEAISDKNMKIAERLKSVDSEKAQRFVNHCQRFTLFATEAPLLTVVLASQYTPTGYDEIKLLDETADILYDLEGLRNPGMQNIGAAVEHFNLKAVELGYGTCWLTSANYAAPEIEDLLRKEGIVQDDSLFMVCMLAMGVPDGEGKSPRKKALEDVYTLIE